MRVNAKSFSACEPLEARQLLHAGHDHGDLQPLNASGTVYVDVGNIEEPYLDASSTSWAPDVGFSKSKRVRGKFAVAGTEDDQLFTTRRQGLFNYTIPVTDGNYTLSLLFVDTAKKAGKRVFNVDAEGQRIEAALDIAARVGARTALTVSHDVTVSGGALDLAFTRVRGQAVLSGISLVPVAVTAPTPTKPAAPSNVSALAQSPTSVVVNWSDNSNDETGFTVERSSNGVDFAEIATVAASTVQYADATVAAGTTYQYRVRASGAGEASDYSNTGSVTTPGATIPKPVAPSGLTAVSPSPTSVNVSWVDNSSDETGFVVERSVSGGVFGQVASLPAGTTQYADSAVTAGTTYQYRVRATGSGEPSDYSNIASATPAVPTPTAQWVAGASLPIAMGEVAAGIIGDRMYVVGDGTNQTLAYNISTNSWTTGLATRPFVGNHHGAEVIGGKLFLIGGIGASSGKLQVYDPATNSWSVKASMPFSAGSSATSVIDGKIYAAGGVVGTSSSNNAGTGSTAQAAVYNPANDTWSNLPSMPLNLNHAASATDGRLFYVFGGRGGNNNTSNGFNTVQIFDPSTNTWRTSDNASDGIAPLPQARGGTGKAVFANGEFYVMGGETKNGAGANSFHTYNRVDIYNPTTNTWRRGPDMITGRHGIFPVVNNGHIYVAGGGPRSMQDGFNATNIMEILNI